MLWVSTGVRGEIKPRCREGQCCVGEDISVWLKESTIRKVKPDPCLTGLRELDQEERRGGHSACCGVDQPSAVFCWIRPGE